MPLRLLHLPKELLVHVVQSVAGPEHQEDDWESVTCCYSKDSLRALQELRLSCRTFCNIATPVLFERVGLYPWQESRKRYGKILEDNKLRKYVRDLCINTVDEDEAEDGSQEDVPVEEGFVLALRRFTQFPSLNTVTLRLSSNCCSYNIDQPWPQSTNFRRPILRDVFGTLAKTSITDISLLNLQDINDEELLGSADFQSVLTRLTSLALQICTEEDQAAPEHSIEIPSLHTFFPALPPTWLAPTTTTLTRLVLYSDRYAGWCPHLDPTALHFPRLAALALGRYTLASPAPVDWIARHASTLRALTLHDCPILVYRVVVAPLRLQADGVSVTVAPRVGGTARGRPPVQAYQYTDLRWAGVFRRLGEEMTVLRDFWVCSAGWRRGELAAARERVENLRSELSAERYAWFDGGYHKLNMFGVGGVLRRMREGRDSPVWREWAEFVEKCAVGMDKEQDLEDVTALEEMLVKIGMRGKGSGAETFENYRGDKSVRF